MTDAERSAPVKNSAAYRTVFLGDDEGRAAMAEPREFMGNAVNPCTFLFEVRWNSSGDYHSESRVISGSQGTRNQAGAAAFSRGKKVELEKMENEASLQVTDLMERPMRIELTPEPWQGSVLPLY